MAYLWLTDQDTSHRYGPFGGYAVQSMAMTSTLQEKQLANNQSVLVSQVDPDDLRPFSNMRWVLQWYPVRDESKVKFTTRQVKSLFIGWWHRQCLLTMDGPDMLDLDGEVLRPIVAGTNAYKIYYGALPWWSSGATILKNGSGVSPTIDADAGKVTFASANIASDIITATVARKPQVRVMGVEAAPENGRNPVIYSITVQLREDAP